jgi:hypothetical protein
MKSKFYLLILTVLLVGCTTLNNNAAPTPEATATLQPTPKPTHTATALPTPTQDLYTKYLNDLPELPEGLTWQIMVEKSLAMAVPDGWFLKEENRIEQGLYGAYVTRENIDELGYFYAGISVMLYDFDTKEDADIYAKAMIYAQSIQETTLEVLDQSLVEREDGTLYLIRIHAEFPYEVEGNQDKTIQYAATVVGNHVVFIIFEAPTEEWDAFFEEYDILGSYVAYFYDE